MVFGKVSNDSINSIPFEKDDQKFGCDSDAKTEELSSLGSSSSSGMDNEVLYQHNDYNEEDDEYADVRERMEELSRTDREAHLHSHDPLKIDSGMDKEMIQIPFFAAMTTYLGYLVLILFGHIRDTCASVFRNGRYRSDNLDETKDMDKFAVLLKDWENFYTRRLYHRIQDCFNRPIASNPGAVIDVLERVSNDGNKTMEILGEKSQAGPRGEEYASGQHVSYVSQFEPTPNNLTSPATSDQIEKKGRVARHCLNLGSYNYLGFADDWNATCGKDVIASLDEFPVSTGSSRFELGSTVLHAKLEKLVANFIGKEDAVCFNMGFNTNTTTIPALVGSQDLLISDELNHTSIVNGARASGAAIRTFRHNNSNHLEGIIREAIIMGRPKSRRPWGKILVIVEGIYSMEGEYCNLRAIVDVCKKYGAYVYLDEAHSIGAMGPSGRGCAEYCGVDTNDIDVMMGTFTKSFGGMGGYIAASKEVVAFLRSECKGSTFHNSLSPVVCQQVISAFRVINGEDGSTRGQEKLTALRDNSNYMRMKLTDMGLHVLGNYDSPIMPVMLYNPTKIAAFSRECFKRGLAVVVVGFPAVPILMSRARFCISAGHTRKDLDRALCEIDEIADILKLRYVRSTLG